MMRTSRKRYYVERVLDWENNKYHKIIRAGLLGIREITEVNAVFDKSTVNPVFSKPDHINIKMSFDVKDYL